MPVAAHRLCGVARLIAVVNMPAGEIAAVRKHFGYLIRGAIVIARRQAGKADFQPRQHVEPLLPEFRIEAALEKIAGDDDRADVVSAGGGDKRRQLLAGAAKRDRVAEPLPGRAVAEVHIGQHGGGARPVHGETLWQQQPVVQHAHGHLAVVSGCVA
jgi:hypothetical protein